ncbi:PadR family transcriptional regulator [Arthrobacter psychrolactophilus]|uniref:PadR family transcriptional regulator n=1 Tax=Arthrobacter psychrolactophilus TaxID=92442 RepID=A0A2V5ITK6_9MICC|nr:PadR family transcriptional regulator [Arthrobacter psychrolactophilus]PYI37544.1 PadR family transcriptional regulator [Arthrobacter psychrolactophilus]
MSLAGWQRASLPMLILSVLESQPRHGYGVSQALVKVGLQPIKGAQLYPTLVKLEADGAISATWEPAASGPARKVYSISGPGREQLATLRLEWERFSKAARALGV